MRARRALVGCALLASSCSGRGEIIPTPSPEPETPTTTPELISAAPAPVPPTSTTTTEPEPEPITTEAPATTVRTRSTTTTEYLRPVATTVIETSTEWSIPTYIVMCESGGDWNAYNPSGASGPYQLMPMHFNGELAMHQSRAAQHAKAAELWNGGKGKSHWSACL